MVVVCAVAVLIVLILFLPIRAELMYKNGCIFYVKILNLKLKQPKRKKKSASKNKSDNKKVAPIKILNKVFDLKDDLKSITEFSASKCIVIENIKFHIAYGMDDAAATGCATGVINGIVYGLLGIIHNKTKLKNSNIKIQPDFENEKLEFDFLCIVRTRLLHIIRVGIKGLKLYKKFKEE